MDKITGNEPATPCNYVVTENGNVFNSVEDKMGGLTIRQYFAAMSNPDMEGWSTATVESLTGMKYSDKDYFNNMKIWSKFKAILQVIEADALIEELNKTKQ